MFCIYMRIYVASIPCLDRLIVIMCDKEQEKKRKIAIRVYIPGDS